MNDLIEKINPHKKSIYLSYFPQLHVKKFLKHWLYNIFFLASNPKQLEIKNILAKFLALSMHHLPSFVKFPCCFLFLVAYV